MCVDGVRDSGCVVVPAPPPLLEGWRADGPASVERSRSGRGGVTAPTEGLKFAEGMCWWGDRLLGDGWGNGADHRGHPAASPQDPWAASIAENYTLAISGLVAKARAEAEGLAKATGVPPVKFAIVG